MFRSLLFSKKLLNASARYTTVPAWGLSGSDACMKKLPVVDPEKYINDIYRTCDDPVLLACIPMLSDRFRQLSKMKNPVVVSAHLLLTVIHLETEYKSAKNMGGIFNGEMLPDVLSGIINHTTCETGIDAISDAIKCCMIFSCDEHRVATNRF